jgi:hypothetical protein
MLVADAISSERGRLAAAIVEARGRVMAKYQRTIRIPTWGGAEVVHTRIRRFVEVFAQIQERLVVGGLGTQAFV